MRYALALIACLTPASLRAQEGDETPTHDGDRLRFELSSGVDFEEGEFGTSSRIEKIAVPVTGRASIGRLRLSAQLPWVRVTAPQNVMALAGPLGLPILVDPNRPAGVSTRQGVGDLRLNLSYDLPVDGVAASIRAGVKLPTASTSKGLGTGARDYEAGLDLSTKAGAVMPFASVTYVSRGDPAGLDLKNSVAVQTGAAHCVWANRHLPIWATATPHGLPMFHQTTSASLAGSARRSALELRSAPMAQVA